MPISINDFCDPKTEEALIGCALINPSAIPDVNTSDFFVVKNQWIWDAIKKLKYVDALTVAEALGDRLEEAGGHAYIASLMTSVPHTLHAEAYAETAICAT